MSSTAKRQMFVYCLLGLLSICASFITGMGLFALIMSLVFMYRTIHLPEAVNKFIVRACFAVVLQLAVFNALGLILHLTGVDVSAVMYSIVSLLSVGVVFVVQSTTGKLPHIVGVSRFDLVALAPVLLGLIVLLVYIFGNSLSFSDNLVRFMGSSSDQSAHLSMFNDILRNDGNHVYATDKLSINTPGINSYPMGWHQSMAVLSLNIFHIQPEVVPFIDVIAVYFVCALLTFILYGAILSALTGLIYDSVYSRKRAGVSNGRLEKIQEIIIKSFAVLAVVFLFLYVVLCELGYINFIYSSAIVILGAVLLMGLAKPAKTSADILFLLSALLFVATESWYIMAVPIGIVLAYLSIVYLRVDGIKAVLKRLSSLALIICYAFIFLALAAILYNVLMDGSSEQIQIGNAAAPWLPDILVLLAVVVSTVLLSNRYKVGALHIVVNGFFITILLLSLLNFLHLQAYSYYQQKMLYAFFALGIPIAFIALVRLLQYIKINLILILAIIPFVVYTINPSDVVYITKNIMRPKNDTEIKIISQYFQSRFDDRSEIIFIKDYRTSDERFTEPYARLLLSKVVSPGDCYNQLIMPLLSLSSQSGQSQTDSNSAADEAADRCYSNVRFIQLSDDTPVIVE